MSGETIDKYGWSGTRLTLLVKGPENAKLLESSGEYYTKRMGIRVKRRGVF